jgi:hypothetical protein
MDTRGGMELREVLDSLKYIKKDNLLTYGKIKKYIKYCEIEKKSSRRNKYHPGRNKWKLPTPKMPENDNEVFDPKEGKWVKTSTEKPRQREDWWNEGPIISLADAIFRDEMNKLTDED